MKSANDLNQKSNVALASTNTITQTTPSVTRVEEIFMNEILGSRTFDPSVGIGMYTAVRNVFSMFTGSTANMLQDYACKPTPTGDVSLVDEEFTLLTQSIFHEVCYDKFVNTQWKDAIANIANQGLPAEFENFLVSYTTSDIGSTIENNLWNSNGGATGDPTTTMDGFRKVVSDILTAATLPAQIVVLAADPTLKANVIAAMEQMTNAAPAALIADRANSRLFVAPGVDYAYRLALQDKAYAVLASEPTNIGGFQIEVIPNLNPNTMLLGKPGNLGVGMAMENEIVDLSVIDQYTLGQGNFARIVGNVGYGAGAATTDWVVGATA